MSIKPNFEVLDAAIDWAIQESKKPVKKRLYDQDHFGYEKPCGTAHCLAGHIVAEAGYQPIKTFYDGELLGANWFTVYHPSDPDTVLDTWDTAADLAGLEAEGAGGISSKNFFAMWLTLNQIKASRDQLAEEHGVPARYTGES